MPDETIKRFVDLHKQTEELLHQNDVKGAKQKYIEVVNAYHDIQNSSLERFHKELAYDQVTQLFQRVSDAKERVQIPYNIIVAAILVIVFSFVILFKPSVVGLYGFEDTVKQPLGKTFTESAIEQIALRDKPLRFAISGTSNGSAKVYLREADRLELVYDTAGQTGPFDNVCAESCQTNLKSSSIELLVQVESGSITIDELIYTIERKDNGAPFWKHNTQIFSATVGTPLILNLDDYFADPENDQLVYVSSTDEGLDIVVEQNMLTLTAQTSGTKHINIIASDLLEVSRVAVTINVQ